MVEEGREYAIALRGDPVAGASLLSVSIQAAMLFGRILDPPGESFLFGTTGFLFTDDLDVTNRFYDDLRDAEGGQSRSGKPGRKPVLAGLRSPDLPQQSERYRDGQSWDIVNKIGRYLAPDLHAGELQIGRTSSQDSGRRRRRRSRRGHGVPGTWLQRPAGGPDPPAQGPARHRRADPAAGPRRPSARHPPDDRHHALGLRPRPAGVPGIRDALRAGTDRQRLPVKNRYVLKIHAAQSLLDWLGRDIRRMHHWADPRLLLTASGRNSGCMMAPRRLARRPPSGTPHQQGPQDNLARHLQAALQISADEAQAVLWEQPRSLLLAAAPTALRRLRSNWRPMRKDPGAEPGPCSRSSSPAPCSSPSTCLRSSSTLPFDTGRDAERLPIARALREAVPGRVSRRYGYKRDEHRAWMADSRWRRPGHRTGRHSRPRCPPRRANGTRTGTVPVRL